MKFSVFDTFEEDGAVCVDPLPDQVSRFVLVGLVIREKDVPIAVEDEGPEGV